MSDILEEIVKFILKFIVGFLLICTGEVVLFVITFGRYKPTWKMYGEENGLSWSEIFSHFSLYVGLAFWIVVIVLLRKYFLGN